MAQAPESKLKRDMKVMLRKRGAAFFPIPGGAYGMEGAPDIVVCHHSRFLAIEAKTETGRQSEVQKIRQRWIESAGGIYLLARSVSEVERTLDEIEERCEEGA